MTNTTMFSTVLVANRGEIACRVIRTLKDLGIRSVAVYSDADRGARHVMMADVAERIGPAPATESYLNIDAIIAAAKRSGAQAIHPGYGFLSENAAFAEACESAGIVFVGPDVNALAVMGDKIRSKNHVASHGVPVIPGIAEPGLDDEALVRAASEVGYPLLIKPSAGGGGKGMQAVESETGLAEAIGTARRVAKSAFGDDTLFLERLIAKPRHIEVQVLADTHGNTIHLGERECSLQRRHQKVIEEAPSALLDEATRARIGQAACQAARSVGYTGAGTVEFLVPGDAPDKFFFMEMNTRLQVEHPVTEMVAGIDLVEWQLRVAAGQVLPIAQDDVRLTGHAIEARLYAENPERGFLPSSGIVVGLHEASGPGVRVDSALMEGLEVSSHYDPMLAKVIAWGDTREEAVARLDAALAHTTVLGLDTNIEYLRLLLADPDVRAGELDTGLIERRMPQLDFRHADATILAAAALYLHLQGFLSAEQQVGPRSLWHQPTGWRMGTHEPARYRLVLKGNEVVDVLVTGHPQDALVTIGTAEVRAAVRALTPVKFSVNYGEQTQTVLIAEERADDGSLTLWLGDNGFVCSLMVPSREASLDALLADLERAEGVVRPEVRTPMPGTVITVSVSTGDTVSTGQTLLTVEAMKMEHKLAAPVDGVVSVTVKPGDLVKLDQLVATVTAVEPEAAGAEAADTEVADTEAADTEAADTGARHE